MKTFFISACFLLLAGCAGTGAPYSNNLAPPHKKETQLILYRQSALIGALESPNVSVNGELKCSLPSGSYFVSNVAPAKLNVRASNYGGTVASTISFTAKPGERYYIKLSYNSGTALAGGFGLLGAGINAAVSEDTAPYKIGLVDEGTASSELLETNLSNCD